MTERRAPQLSDRERHSQEIAAATGFPLAAFAVHLFTASGAVVGLLALLAAGRGELGAAGLWMLVAFAIDSLDGSLARRFRVAERVRRIDGARLDDIVDYLNYVVVPVYFLAANGLAPVPVAALPLLASAYQFTQQDAKTDDHFFLGFPSFWNFVALYAWLLDATPFTTGAWLAGLSVLVFVPIKYLYPSYLLRLRWPVLAATIAWVIALVWMCAAPASPLRSAVAWASLAYPAMYGVLSLWLGGWHARSTRG